MLPKKELLLYLALWSCCWIGCEARSKYVSEEEDNPYEFGFTIDGQQHRHEKKDANGVIQGEFGFITADGVYHVTVYATDENGNFRILSMRNVRVSGPLDEPNAKLPDTSQFSKGQANAVAVNPLSISTTPAPAQTIRPVTQSSGFTTQPTIKPACAGCGYVTHKTPLETKLPFQTAAGEGAAKPGSTFIGSQAPQSPSSGFNAPSGAVAPFVSNNGQSPVQQGSFHGNQPQSNPSQNYPQPEVGNGGTQPNYPQGGGAQSNSPQIGGPQSNYPQGGGAQSNYPQTGSAQSNYPTNNQQYPQVAGPQDHTNTNYDTNHPANQPQPQSPQSDPLLNPLSIANPNNQLNQPGAVGPSGITVANGVINVPNNPPITIQDKFPNMVDGLPAGISEENITDLLYKFNYTVGFHGHYEKGYKNGAKVGGYFVNDRDGVSRIVTYVADENGYRPKVKFIRLDLTSDLVPKEGSEKTFGLKNFEFVWYPLN